MDEERKKISELVLVYAETATVLMVWLSHLYQFFSTSAALMFVTHDGG